MFYFLFWFSVLILAAGTVIYPLLLSVVARLRSRVVAKAAYQPRLSVVMPCHNEEAFIARKIHNLLELNYPADKLEVVVVLDGSTDRTEVILDFFLPHPQLQVISLPQAGGMTQAWNAGAAVATGEVLIFTDARQLLQQESLQALAANFADPGVGAVTGGRVDLPAQEGKKRKIKKVKLKDLIRRLRYQVKRWETRIHSVTEVNEALFGCRKTLYCPVPPTFVLPGLAVLLQVVQQGGRVVFEAQALLYDTEKYPLRQEIERYRRLFTGYFQLLFTSLVPGKAAPRPIWWQLALHNWVRLTFPVLLLLLFVSNLFIANSWFYNSFLLAQLLVIGLCLLSIVFRKPLLFYLISRFNILVVQSCYDFLNNLARGKAHNSRKA